MSDCDMPQTGSDSERAALAGAELEAYHQQRRVQAQAERATPEVVQGLLYGVPPAEPLEPAEPDADGKPVEPGQPPPPRGEART